MDRWKRTLKSVPLGVQTMSKRPSQYAKGYPKYIEYAWGCHVGANFKSYIDYTCALGAIILGYQNKEIDQYVKFQINEGILYSLPSHKETELAEKLIEIIPCAEMVRFLKTGSEATSAAIKIARSYTKREHIASFGYHGWHNWCQVATTQDKGIPKGDRKLFHEFKYNDLSGVEKILKKYDVAAVIINPYEYEYPKDDFLWEIIELSHKYGALTIFDEIVTGFRTFGISAQAYFNIIPDLATFSKAMANGYSISAIVGKRKYMKELEKGCFLSSTFGGDLIGISAALATIDFIERNNVIDHIWKMGNILMKDLPMSGFSCRPKFDLKRKELVKFWSRCIKKGVFFGDAFFINYSHKEEDIDYTRKVIKECL